MQSLKSPTIREKLCVINGSIWYSSAHKSLHKSGENGIAEYCIKTNQITNVISYPSHIQPNRQCVCQYKDKIYIIDGENDQIIEFDPFRKKFVVKHTINNIGAYPSAIVIHDKIHIMHGKTNYKHHVIYDINWTSQNNPKYVVVGDLGTNTRMSCVAVLKYKNQIIKIAGDTYGKWDYENKFLISSKINDKDDHDNILWIEKPEWKLPKRIYRFGHVLYKHYIIIFGGNTNKSYSGFVSENTIYVLDLNCDDGWEEIKHIKCPLSSNYLAVLTDDNYVHLITETNVWPNWRDSQRRHYSIHISTILGSKFSNDLSV